MPSPFRFLNTSWKINLLLLLASTSIYTCYFGHVFLQLNSLLSSNTLDSLKNYYTFVYHIRQDADLLHFSGMNFPYGEHLVYTDCQPILSLVLRLLPFTHPYLIGILHGLLFLSFIVSPLILHKIFQMLGIDRFTSFFLSLGLALLAPQFVKIVGGHYALAYGCIIPLSVYLLLNYLQKAEIKTLLLLFLYNVLLFSLHPYLGFCGAIFTGASLFGAALFNRSGKSLLKPLLYAAASGLGPLLLFKLFMFLTDHHPNRPVEPFGSEVLVENIDSLLAPEFGPFQSLMEFLFPNRTQHYEGHSYLGFAVILLSCVFVFLLPVYFRKLKPAKEMALIFFASLLLLFLAFGWHNKVFAVLGIESLTFKQLRATSRFAWYVYYCLPLFVIPSLYHLAKEVLQPGVFKKLLVTLALMFFGCNLLEAHYFFKKDQQAFWNCRNVFNAEQLNAEERSVLAALKTSSAQAIVPLPVFHGGSEFYDRLGFNNSMLPAMLYSYHSGVPILSSLMSRSSLRESENSLGLLNNYKHTREVLTKLNGHPFLVLRTRDELLPDEERLAKNLNFFGNNDTLSFALVNQADFLARKIDSAQVVLSKALPTLADSTGLIYIHHLDRKPFLNANINDYEHLYQLDSNRITSGNYVLSLHYYFEQQRYRALACDVIVVREDGQHSEWHYILPVRYMSGYYSGYGVVERKIFLERNCRYVFMLKGNSDLSYRVSDLLLRPEHLSVIVPGKNDSLINNYSTR